MVSEDGPAPAADAPTETVPLGGTLRAAREAQRLSLDQVSELLRIDARFLVALEEERFDAIGPPVFVKGYLRHYCELLGLDSTRLLDAHADRIGKVEPIVQARRSIGRAPERPIAPLLLGAAAVALLGLFLWRAPPGLLGRIGSPAAPDEAVIETVADTTAIEAATDATAIETAPDATAIDAAADAPAIEASFAPAIDAADAAVIGSTDAAALKSTDAAASGSIAAPAVEAATDGPANETIADTAAEPAAGSDAGAVRAPAPALDSAAVPPAAAEPGDQGLRPPEAAPAVVAGLTGGAAPAAEVSVAEAAPVAAPLEIELRFLEDSWTTITGADDERLYYGLGRAGDQERISASTAVRVLLGNAEGVEIRVNGEPYAYPPGSRRGDIAQFTLSPARD
ncbi:MAG TPA: RodZ domain-containing protein [Gammaproteobacteria bacterium]